MSWVQAYTHAVERAIWYVLTNQPIVLSARARLILILTLSSPETVWAHPLLSLHR